MNEVSMKVNACAQHIGLMALNFTSFCQENPDFVVHNSIFVPLIYPLKDSLAYCHTHSKWSNLGDKDRPT